ncbi:MAG: O-antigen ligase family protein [Elusimicrobiota bacterium]
MKKHILIGLTLIFFVAPWWKGSKETIPFSILSLPTFILLFYWLKLSWQENKLSFLKDRIWEPIIIFYLFSIISSLNSVYSGNAWELLFRLVVYFFLFLLISRYATMNFSFFIYFLLFLISLTQGIIVLGQYYLGQPLLGTFTNPNHLAGYLVCGLVSGLGYLLFSKLAKIQKIAVISGCFFLSAVIFLFNSRSALLALILVSLMLLYAKFSYRGIIGAAIVLLIIFSLLPRQRLASLAKIDLNSVYRVKIWQSALEMVKEHPFLGWGLGNFEYGFEKYAYPRTDRLARYGQSTRFAHNEFLQIASELGLPALIFFLGAIFILLKRIDQKRRLFSEENKSIILMAGANVAVLLLQGFFEFNLHSPAVALVFVYSSAFALAPWNGEIGSAEFNNFRKIISGFALAALVCWLAAGLFNRNNFHLHRKSGDTYSLLAGEENFRQALTEYKLALADKPNDVFSLFSLGQLFLRKLEYKKAGDYFLQAIRFEPYFLDCWFNLGLSFAGRGDYKKALGYYQQLLKLKQHCDQNFSFSAGYENSLMLVDWPNFYNYLAAAYFHLGDYPPALENCRKSLELLPENRSFLTNLKLIQNKMERKN